MDVGFTGQAGSGLFMGKSVVTSLFIHHLWVTFTGNSISQTQSLISMKKNFFSGQVHVRKKMKPHSLKLWLNTIMKGFGGL